ncbi:MAG: prefoldin subunit beta [Thermoplasmata archaeon]|nr:prefoldin subunit beta [Thermoplasmata archaeon]
MDNISPKVQNMIAQYQELTQRIQTFATQRYALEVQSKELERAIQELEKSKDDAVIYRSAGNLLIQNKDKAALVTELKEQKETIDVRSTSFERQEKQLRERHTSLQQQISQELGGTPGTDSQDAG